MAFTLRDVRTGTVRSFTTREILSLLGDSINDEIDTVRPRLSIAGPIGVETFFRGDR